MRLLNVDIDKFWADDALSHGDNCFTPAAPQVALGIRMSDECVFAELGEEGEPWLPLPLSRRIELNKRYNEKAVNVVGIPLLQEVFLPEDAAFPKTGDFTTLFEARHVIKGGSEWLESNIRTEEDLEAVLDRVEGRLTDLRRFLLPPHWDAEKKRLFEEYGLQPSQTRDIRGPVTFAMTYMGVENFIFTMMDAPDLIARFRDVLTRAIIDCAHLFDEEAGFTTVTAPHGFSFCDDDCCLLNEEMYEGFGYPILQRVFETFSPDEADIRYQHSDSPMEHLLPILARLKLNGVNFGPTVTFDKIRKVMPQARVDGCVAPFTFMNNDEDKIIAEVRRDCEMAKGTRGLNLSTAGSINNGSLLTSMRTVIAAIQNYGRY